MEHSNGKHFRMFTNSFGDFLNVQEHFKKFQWNILKCSPTNFHMNIFNNSQNFLRKNSEFVLKHFFDSTLWFEMFTIMFWNFLNVQEHFKKFQWNILKCSPTNFKKKVPEQSTKQIRMFRNTFWKLVNVSKQIWMSGTLWIVSKALKVFRNTLEIWMFLIKSKCFGTKMNVSEHSQKSECSRTLFWNHLNVPK